MKRRWQRGDHAASGRAGENLPVEDARNPDRRAVARNAFDEAVPGIDREERLRLNRCGGSEGQQADQRRAPAMSF